MAAVLACGPGAVLSHGSAAALWGFGRQSLVDLAAELDKDSLEAAIAEADKRDLIDPEHLRAALTSWRTRPGLTNLKQILDRRTFRLTDSHLERLFLPIARRAGLPTPETRRHEGGFRIDFCWHELRLIVETDGLRYHRTPAEQARDRLRDQAHTAAGLTQLRFTHEQVRYAPDYVVRILAQTASRFAIATK